MLKVGNAGQDGAPVRAAVRGDLRTGGIIHRAGGKDPVKIRGVGIIEKTARAVHTDDQHVLVRAEGIRGSLIAGGKSRDAAKKQHQDTNGNADDFFS